METPVPGDRTALQHVLGILRYYYWGCTDHALMRDYIALLSQLDVPHTVVSTCWTPAHSDAMYGALRLITAGNWILVYDPTQRVVVTTDASGSHGFSVVANQWDKESGEMRPISYLSQAWKGPQLSWKPQVKECYAQMVAVTQMMPRHFPYAWVDLLCDNKNLTSLAESADARVVRWQADIVNAGVRMRFWIPGDWNTIADYASRVVVAKPTADLSEEEQHEMYVYAIVFDADKPAADEHALSGCASLVDGSCGGGPSSAARVMNEAGHPEVSAPPAGGAASGAARAMAGAGAGAGDSIAARAVAVSPGRETGGYAVPVPGHLAMAPMVSQIADAQLKADPAERSTWRGGKFSTAVLGGRTLILFQNKLVVPRTARELKETLMRMAHDDAAHFAGAERTVLHLQTQARVYWVNMSDDVSRYVNSCFRCQFAKAGSKEKAMEGLLAPTISPHVHHTWYVDLKGPMPHGTGYIMAVVESITRMVKLRYLPKANAAEVLEELDEAIVSFGTRPVVMRSDGGQPFDSAEFKLWCERNGISPVKGVPHHSQGQGLVETRFRGIASSIMAVLGEKAPRAWWEKGLLARLEELINSSFCESLHGSPFWAMHGFEPRTLLSANADWTSRTFGADTLELPIASFEDYMQIIVAHHSAAAAVHGRTMIATSVAQALTKRAWDAARGEGTYAVGDYVLVHRTAPNRMLPHFIGPYAVTEVSADKNFVWVQHYVDKTSTGRVGPVHVQRLVHFDASRATPADVAEFQVDVGSFIVDEVLEHRVMKDGSVEYHIRWRGNPITSWETAANVGRVVIVQEYCSSHGLALLPKSALVTPSAARASSARAPMVAARAVSFSLPQRGGSPPPARSGGGGRGGGRGRGRGGSAAGGRA
jgi:hypothetical protein